MPSKMGVVVAGLALATLLAGRVGNGSVAWAQDADVQSDEAAAQDEAASQDVDASPDEAYGDVAKAKPTPVSANGVYSGTVMDANGGAGTISAAISQIRTKIIGTWQDTFVPPAFIQGTMNAKGKMSLRMKFYIRGNCGYIFSGNFTNGNEISGTYKLTACGRKFPADHGTLDMIKQ